MGSVITATVTNAMTSNLNVHIDNKDVSRYLLLLIYGEPFFLGGGAVSLILMAD